MAIELDTSSNPTLVDRGAIPTTAISFATNGVEDDAQTAKEIVVAPGASKNHYITRIVLQCETAAVDPQIQDNATSAAVLFGPIYTTANGVPIDVNFPRPIKVAANKAIELKAAGAGAVFVFIEGLSG